MPDEIIKQPETQTEQNIDVDVFGVSVSMPMSKAKELIGRRDNKTKEYNDLKGKIDIAEKTAKQELEKNSLLTAMKAQDIESVKSQISSEYVSKISQLEQKVYGGEVAKTLAELGVLPEAISDAAKLAMTDVAFSIKEDKIMAGEKELKEYITEWTKTRNHLLSVKKQEGKMIRQATAIKPEKAGSLSSGISKFMKK